MIRIHSIIPESIVDGPGIRAAVFTQGCAHKCPGCHNPDTWDFNGGTDVSIEYILEKIHSNPLIKGVTLTGGDPIYQWKELLPLVQQLKEEQYNLGLYTGFSNKNILSAMRDPFAKIIREASWIKPTDNVGRYFSIDANPHTFKEQIYDRTLFLSLFDFVITEPFQLENKSSELKFRGSTNQQVFQFDLCFNRDTQIYWFAMNNITEKWDKGDS